MTSTLVTRLSTATSTATIDSPLSLSLGVLTGQWLLRELDWIKRCFESRRSEHKSTATPDVVPTQNAIQSNPSVQEPLPEESPAELVRIEAPLKNLPAEIRRHVLFTLEYDESKALVHASPVYHQQYLLDRQRLLCTCLEANLGSITTDARAVYQSNLVEFSKTRTEDTITQFLGLYQDRRRSYPSWRHLPWMKSHQWRPLNS